MIRTRSLVPAWALAASLLAACGGGQARAKTVSVRMAGAPSSASVTVDDQLVGTLDVLTARGMALRPGHHRVSVEAPGYFPWDKEIDATEAPVQLDVRLVPVPD